MIKERIFGFTVGSEEIAEAFEERVERKPTDEELNQVMDELEDCLWRGPFKYGYTEWDVYDLLPDILYKYVKEE